MVEVEFRQADSCDDRLVKSQQKVDRLGNNTHIRHRRFPERERHTYTKRNVTRTSQSRLTGRSAFHTLQTHAHTHHRGVESTGPETERIEG